MHIGIVVESRLSGSAAGHVTLRPDNSEFVHSIIEYFCVEKGIRQSRQYVLRNGNDEVLDFNKPLVQCGVVDGDTLFLTMPKEDMFGFHNWFLMSAGAFFISLLGFIAISILFSKNGDIPDDFGIVFDAGSTHTSMFVYSWVGSKQNGTGAPRQVHQCNMKGFSIYLSLDGSLNKDQMKTDLKKCLEEGKSNIPGGQVGTTPLFLGATAGMRLLNITNSSIADEIMQVIGETFSTSGFYYQDGMAAIISGDKEGVDAWTTTNYAENILTSNLRNISTMGTLDLGGASTQFAVETNNGLRLDANVTVDQLTMYGDQMNVSTHSYLCFGQVQANLRYQAQLIQGLNKSQPLVVLDPCLPKDLNLTLTLGEIYGSPCTELKQSLKPTFNKTTQVTFVGASNYTQCISSVAVLLDNSYCNSHYQYSYCFEKEDLGGLQQQFLAISGFYEIVEIFNLTQPTLKEFNKAVEDSCTSTWPKARYFEKRLIEEKKSFAEKYCFDGVYVSLLLTSGYNFSESSWKYLTFQNTVNGIDLGWSMGLLINATNSIAAEMPTTHINLATFVFLTVLFSVFFMVSVALLVHAWKRNEKVKPKYKRLTQYGAI